jgi:hypothetical protein
MFNYEASPTVINCLFFENTANLGGAVYNYFHSAPVYTNCTFVKNTGLINGAGIYNNFYANTTVNNAIIWGNTGIQVFNNASTLSIKNAIIEGGCPVGYDCTNVSDQDPQFLDAAADNFQLSLTSPAIGTGNSAANNTAIDLAGNPRTSTGGALDLGALQNQRAAYVNDDANGSNDGSSWANAFNNLQDALAYAANEPLITQIWIAEGTYTPDQGVGFTAGDRNASFSMQNDLAIYGGFPNTGNPNLTDRDWAANETTLSGDIGIIGINTDNSKRIVSNNGLDNTAVLDGLTIKDAYSESSSATLDGGGMLNIDASPNIRNCIFRNNNIDANGGAVANYNASPEFTNCLFIENSAGSGGAFYTQDGTLTLTNCTFVKNSAQTGSAITGNFSSTSYTLTNCIIWGNHISDPIFNNQSASANITYSIVQGSYSGAGNLSIDPLFVDAASSIFRLQACSPAIDAGTGTNALSVDLGGNPRIVNNGIDMGAYEFQATPTPVIPQCQPRTVLLNTDGNGSLLASELNDGSMGCGTLSFEVNSETSLQYSCADVGTSIFTLTVTDGRGQMASCTAEVTVEDEVAPLAICQNVTVQLDANGNGTTTVQSVDNGSSDACGIASIFLSQTSFGCSEVGENIETLTITDINGNVSTCNATVTVEDNNPPVAVCANPTVNLTSGGVTTIDASFFDGGSSATCPDGPVPGGGVNLSASMTDFDCEDVGNTYNVTLIVTAQGSGQSSTCTATVSVEDPNSFCCAPPTAICDNITVALDANGQANVLPATVGGNSIAECGLQSETLSEMNFDCSDVGTTRDVTYSITDVNGDNDNCTATLTIALGTTLPDGWNSSNIGSHPQGTDYGFDPCTNINPGNGTFTITGSGNNATSSTTDNVAFAAQSLCGDGSITAKIESVSPNGYGGLMMRESTAGGAKQVSIFSNLSNILRHETRYTTNGPRQVNSFFKPSPIWLKLERQGDWVFAYYSTTGSNFQYVHGVFLPMQNCAEIGLASFTFMPNAQTEAVFSNVSVTGGNPLNVEVPAITNEVESDKQLPSLYPNPTRDITNLVFEDGLYKDATIILRNQLGQVVEQRQLRAGDYRTEWDVSSLADGLYLFEIRQEGKAVQVLRIVKTQ